MCFGVRSLGLAWALSSLSQQPARLAQKKEKKKKKLFLDELLFEIKYKMAQRLLENFCFGLL
jgi:hypothetical protein